jgi:hypothetical protein
MRVFVRMGVAVVMRMTMFMRMVVMTVLIVALMRVGRPGVNAELHPFNLTALLALEMHVEVSEIQFGELPFQRGGFQPKIAQSADSHVAADARETVEE